MYLVLAIVLGLYWLIRIGTEKSQIKKARAEYDMKFQVEKNARDHWEKAVINQKLQDEFEDRLYNRDEELLAEVAASWDNYFHYPLPEIYIVNKKRGGESDDSIFISTNAYNDLTALRILLSNRGFLTSNDATYGITLHACGDTAVQREADFRIKRDFILAMNENLKKRGINEKMYSDRHGRHEIFPPSDPDCRCGLARIQWKPAIYGSSMLPDASGRSDV